MHYIGRHYDPHLGMIRVRKRGRLAIRGPVARKLIEPLTQDQVNALFRSVHRYRDLIVLLLMLFCGLRSMEVRGLKLAEVSLTERHLKVREARRVLLDQEIEALVDKDAVHEEALRLAEGAGVVFLDEIDKVCGPEEGGRGPDVSRQGVQRDLLPIVEGTTVQTRYGSIKTDHILFIAAGAFHKSKPSDLMPELQGRFPIRVELKDLTRDDFVRILTEPATSLTRQYELLLSSDGVKLKFKKDGVEALADIAYHVNQTSQNIGARRLYTLLERLLEDVSFAAPDGAKKTVTIDAEYVRDKLEAITANEDLTKFIL